MKEAEVKERRKGEDGMWGKDLSQKIDRKRRDEREEGEMDFSIIRIRR